jgi:hypothetical protein
MTAPVAAKDVQPEKIDWLWRRRLPRAMIAIVAGRPDQGKGLFAARVAADVTQDEPVAEDTACGLNVLYSAAEDSHGLMTRPRLEAAGARLDRITLWRFRLPMEWERLQYEVRMRDIGLLVMDPMASHLGGGISRHSDNIRTVIDPLTALIEETGTSVLIVEHALKRISANGDILNVIGGSGSGLTAAARAAYVFGLDPNDDDHRVLAKAKFNIGPSPAPLDFTLDVDEQEIGEIPFLEVGEERDGFDPMSMFTKPKGSNPVGRPPDKRADAAEWLTNYIWAYGKPVPAGLLQEDAKQRQISTKTLRRAADDMGVVKNPPGGGRNCTWDLPDEIKQALAEAEAEAAANMPGGKQPDTPYGEEPLSFTDDDLRKLMGDSEKSDEKDAGSEPEGTNSDEADTAEEDDE